MIDVEKECEDLFDDSSTAWYLVHHGNEIILYCHAHCPLIECVVFWWFGGGLVVGCWVVGVVGWGDDDSVIGIGVIVGCVVISVGIIGIWTIIWSTIWCIVSCTIWCIISCCWYTIF